MIEKPPVETAKPGDVCVLLEPSSNEHAAIKRQQQSLQSIFGGRIHRRIHLTCQRFSLTNDQLVPLLITRFQEGLKMIHPFPLIATSLVSFYAEFWQSHLLRWKIHTSRELHAARIAIEKVLISTNLTPHYPSNWNPTLVTALEEITILDIKNELEKFDFPYPLFNAYQVVLSRINGINDFDILGEVYLA